MGLKEELENLENKEREDRTAKMETLDHLEFEELEVLKEWLVILDQWVCRGQKEIQEFQDNQDLEGTLEKREFMDCLEDQVQLVLQEREAHLVVQGPEAFRDYLEFQEKMVCLEKMEMLEFKAFLD